ncbi:cytochrome c oxidase cbb3-type subunit 4 [Psychrobacter sp. PL15]|jgi:cytochrome c oxidase cbb3-type subunit 4|uniref:cbb3-type cytochrome oxidase subunit 3 n=1 Tax=unclassified Psychrobacter TaxID=196806 RepID=UPI001AE918C0|nr:cbb3-type cytochrome c oxidase subunit 3 [Psychrobacter sp. PL15]MEC5209098.1 cytochrome c oxidase cbb3-type subunit 4 [Psychrobacter sp. PL15]
MDNVIELQIIATVSAFVAFVGIAWWAYSPKNVKRFEEDAQLALDDEDIEAWSKEQRDKDKP